MQIKTLFFLPNVLLLLLSMPTATTTGLETVLRLVNETLVQEMCTRHHLLFKKRLFDSYYVFDTTNTTITKRDVSSSTNKRLKDDPQIEWFQVQHSHKREKRYSRSYHYRTYKEILLSLLVNRKKYRQLCPNKNNIMSNYFNDPLWKAQWYLNEHCPQGIVLNVTHAWHLGFTGRGIVLTIVDDGIEKNNEELVHNYDPSASVDLNDGDNDPQPRYDITNENKHGTRCAGEIAARANNSVCGVGVAYNSRIGGIRLLDGVITDRLEAEALIFNLAHIDVYSASWGPLDNGRVVDGPGTLSRAAFRRGVTYGRAGRGTIYVWAAGNGGRQQDNCNCDGYTASIYTVTIGGVTQQYTMPDYAERCSAMLACTFSSGLFSESGIVTADLRNGCTQRHTGTSASAPIGAGIIALALEANGNLTWRDVQHLIVHTSQSFRVNEGDWLVNGVGKYYSHNFGFGLMNGGKMVTMATRWSSVGKQLMCKVYFLRKVPYTTVATTTEPIVIPAGQIKVFSLRVFHLNNIEQLFTQQDTSSLCNVQINSLEHVVCVVSLDTGGAHVRGQLEVSLASPAGTVSRLVEKRRHDKSARGFRSWHFMSVHYWGERASGVWRMQVSNESPRDVTLTEWHMQLYGLEEAPQVPFV